jgi:hypothetical protein
MVNDVEGANMRNEWKKMDESMNRYIQNYKNVGKENLAALRQQRVNL